METGNQLQCISYETIDRFSHDGELVSNGGYFEGYLQDKIKESREFGPGCPDCPSDRVKRASGQSEPSGRQSKGWRLTFDLPDDSVEVKSVDGQPFGMTFANPMTSSFFLLKLCRRRR